jgi:hypothetical protein
MAGDAGPPHGGQQRWDDHVVVRREGCRKTWAAGSRSNFALTSFMQVDTGNPGRFAGDPYFSRDASVEPVKAALAR